MPHSYTVLFLGGSTNCLDVLAIDYSITKTACYHFRNNMTAILGPTPYYFSRALGHWGGDREGENEE